ncbi:endo-1,3-1,4-beta-glycanase ExoK [Roseovarius aestuarii]|uniref:Beta-glucanase n=1 Tax=Roseovarius aestuarii TaxID=475083 RepID=A0A1X7BTC6_9RHOB|nr:family 16 glycosylhydrolase [Roseovarius aestuarii]SMC12858.1 Endo-1,3-1,4-beta-glycanase ExoK precursor [Roseovarius aestuarii]
MRLLNAPVQRFAMYCVCAAFTAAIGAIFAHPAPAEEVPRGETFFDGFDTLDETLWGVSDGWVNGDWQNCEWSHEALTVKGGTLTLVYSKRKTAKREYICGEIQSRHAYSYGTFEARFRTEGGSGLNAAFFTYIGNHHGKPHDEIDFEVLTRDTGKVSLNTYVSGAGTNGKPVDLPHPSDQAFITYSFIWSEAGIEWYVNGAKVHESQPGSPLPVHAQKIYASLWGSNSFPDWMGNFDPPAGDIKMTIDWIAYTKLGQGCQFKESILCTLDQ